MRAIPAPAAARYAGDRADSALLQSIFQNWEPVLTPPEKSGEIHH